MGTQCSNIFNHIITQNTSRNNFINFISNSLKQNNQNTHNTDSDFNLQSKLLFIRNIQNQFIKQGSKEIQSFQKYPENRFVVQFRDNSNYKGYIDQEGKRQKQGQQTWPDGTKYLGYWKSNLPHGNGILISPNGYTFQGNWRQGIVQGQGKYFGRLGSYQGEWRQNQPNGQGIQTWQDGSKYQGSYKNGKKQGKGKYFWPDKSSYSGDWMDGKINGNGIYCYMDGRVYNGMFRNNKMHGKGTYSWPDGRKYIGQYENDKKSGIGRYIWPDGRYFEGDWNNGKRNGYGKIVYPNKIVKYGIWQDDQKIQESNDVLKEIRIQQIQTDDYRDQLYQNKSPSFTRKQRIVINSSTNIIEDPAAKRRVIIPRTQSRPLYASSISPYKQLKQYYEHYTGQRGIINDELSNRYKFIKSPLRKFNEQQLNGNGSYLAIMKKKKRVGIDRDSGYKEKIDRQITDRLYDRMQIKHRRRDSSFV